MIENQACINILKVGPQNSTTFKWLNTFSYNPPPIIY